MAAPHVLIFYRNMQANAVCHVGLGVNGVHMVKVLRAAGILADTFSTRNSLDMEAQIDRFPSTTHVVIEAPWVPTMEIGRLLRKYPRIVFTCRFHSQIAFLQADLIAVKLLREYLVLQDGDVNFHVSANSGRFSGYVQGTFRSFCTHLPNLYHLDRPTRNRAVPFEHRLLRISSFGAMRVQKNHFSAAAGAQMIARARGCDLEFWISTNREEGGRDVLQNLRNLFSGLKWAKLVENPWQPWAEFRQTVSLMDLCLQPSTTETFNITSADAVAEGVPVVGSSAIEWLPSWSQADADDAADIARAGAFVLGHPHSCEDQRLGLERHIDEGVRRWKKFLGVAA